MGQQLELHHFPNTCTGPLHWHHMVFELLPVWRYSRFFPLKNALVFPSVRWNVPPVERLQSAPSQCTACPLKQRQWQSVSIWSFQLCTHVSGQRSRKAILTHTPTYSLTFYKGLVISDNIWVFELFPDYGQLTNHITNAFLSLFRVLAPGRIHGVYLKVTSLLNEGTARVLYTL